MLDFIAEFFAEAMISGMFGLLTVATDIYNICIENAVALLTGDIKNFGLFSGQGGTQGSALYDIAIAMESSFQVLGVLLVGVFFLMGFCQEAAEKKNHYRPEDIIASVLKLGFCSALVYNVPNIVQGICDFSMALIDMVTSQGGGVSAITLDYSDMQSQILTLLGMANVDDTPACGIGECFIDLVAGLVFLGVTMFCGFITLITAFTRFIKIFVSIPYGSIALSTFAGNHIVQNTAFAYLKYMICIIFEAVTICIVLNICGSFLTSGGADLFGSGTVWELLACKCFICIASVGLVKGAEQLTQRILGLH